MKFIRIKGEPHALALGLACGFFSGMMPVIPFHTALAVGLAFLLKSSKITAALGVWISNPLNWYFLYYANYKVGAWVLQMPADYHPIASIIAAVQAHEHGMAIFGKMMSAGGMMVAVFMLGGVIMGVLMAVPSYFVFLKVFERIKVWRIKRREQKLWRQEYS